MRLLSNDVRFAFRVNAGERRAGQIHFAAYFDSTRRSVVEPVANGLDGADVRRDVFAVDAVAARRAALQLTVLINERDAEAVDFQLGDVLHGRRAQARGPPQPFIKGRRNCPSWLGLLRRARPPPPACLAAEDPPALDLGRPAPHPVELPGRHRVRQAGCAHGAAVAVRQGGRHLRRAGAPGGPPADPPHPGRDLGCGRGRRRHAWTPSG